VHGGTASKRGRLSRAPVEPVATGSLSAAVRKCVASCKPSGVASSDFEVLRCVQCDDHAGPFRCNSTRWPARNTVSGHCMCGCSGLFLALLPCLLPCHACDPAAAADRSAACGCRSPVRGIEAVPSGAWIKAYCCCLPGLCSRTAVSRGRRNSSGLDCEGNGCRRGAGASAAGGCLEMRHGGKIMLQATQHDCCLRKQLVSNADEFCTRLKRMRTRRCSVSSSKGGRRQAMRRSGTSCGCCSPACRPCCGCARAMTHLFWDLSIVRCPCMHHRQLRRSPQCDALRFAVA
jgi:hypothetical protein